MDSHIYLKITKLIHETNDSITLELEEKDNKPISFEAGQFLTFEYIINSEEIRRAYSISSSPDELPKIVVTIKRVPDGFISDHIFGTLKEGVVIKAVPPHGNFNVKRVKGTKNTYVFVGAGSGITPLSSMIKYLLKKDDKAQVYLLYGNRDEDSIIYKEMFENLLQEYPHNFYMTNILSQPSEKWDGLKGRITKEVFIDFINKNIHDRILNSDYFLCGPEGMMETIIDTIGGLGINKNNIHREVYTTSVVEDEEDEKEPIHKVTVIYNSKEYKINVGPGESILECALDAGIDLPNSCQSGTCSTCKAKLLSGQIKLVEQSALSDEEISKGYCLTCVGHPASDNVVILYED